MGCLSALICCRLVSNIEVDSVPGLIIERGTRLISLNRSRRLLTMFETFWCLKPAWFTSRFGIAWQLEDIPFSQLSYERGPIDDR
jgi:hypothetical protein